MVANLPVPDGAELMALPGGVPWGMPLRQQNPDPAPLPFLFSPFQGVGRLLSVRSSGLPKMVVLQALRGGKVSSASSARSSPAAGTDSREAPMDIEADHPRKRARGLGSKDPEGVAAEAAEAASAPTDCAAESQREGEVGPSEGATAEAPRQPTIRELCRLPVGGEEEPYLARAVGAIPRGEAADPLVGRWEGLTRGSRVWADRECAAGFIRGGLHPDIARDLYVLPSETLLSKSAKSLLWGHHYAAALMDRVRDAGRVITALGANNAELRRQVNEVHAGAGPEAIAAAEKRALGSEAEVERIRTELQASMEQGVKFQTRLEASEGKNTELQTHLRASVAEARSTRADSLELICRLEESRGEAWRASEALEAEIRLRPEKDKKLIEDYKGSSGFQLGLVRTGRVSYEGAKGSGPSF
ncbi:hypothetical protein C4D60_Mb02t05900 [Musa balbisiana]|uniref:Uncharacterized protein n=1 Tax=Musa balbisiana TaxID=52838 RepID=A0A4S8I9Y5_MUSBA|nr:hypothetical protein C4D60_Mb02t05900 [Musa balbisiana]